MNRRGIRRPFHEVLQRYFCPACGHNSAGQTFGCPTAFCKRSAQPRNAIDDLVETIELEDVDRQSRPRLATIHPFHPDRQPSHSLVSLKSTCVSVDRYVRSRRLPRGLREQLSRAGMWEFSGKASKGGEVFFDHICYTSDAFKMSLKRSASKEYAA